MDNIPEKLENINQTLEKILAVMQRPENPFVKTLTVAGIGVGVLGIIHVIDTIIKWVGG
jgi:preprotein translocase subunit Sss1